ncbi:hypothetical protein QBC47DRAFT_370240 [Echria macrotheca]|uniref:Uncharacterized protein n=1 Tax=Echria macrotheca TaxID=438768 RepID=A0AAJ0BT04_9PEZI|nr:hypothetical protein QBC47DRAFT_370240 [Echria macrotheca]
MLRPPEVFQIYNDALPASSQPQTPQHLPEARHQSRLRGSYTVPARQSSRYVTRRPVGLFGRRRPDLSPPGLQAPGFTGLYGGIENTDDSALFQHGRLDLETTRSRAPSLANE